MRRDDEIDQLRKSVEDFSAGGYAVDLVVPAVCDCGSEEFFVVFNDEEGVAARICASCEDEAGIADSDEHFDDMDEVQQAQCHCGGEVFRVATGFAFRADEAADREVRWVSVGLRCIVDGVAGIYTDWKIDYSPSAYLIEKA